MNQWPIWVVIGVISVLIVWGMARFSHRRARRLEPLAGLTDPRDAAAAMLAAVAQADAAISDREMEAICSIARRHFGADEETAKEFLASGRWLARGAGELGDFLQNASGPILAQWSTKQRQDLLGMLRTVAHAEGTPGPRVTSALDQFADRLAVAGSRQGDQRLQH